MVMDVDDVGASMAFATVTINRAGRPAVPVQPTSPDDPWATASPVRPSNPAPSATTAAPDVEHPF